MPTLLPPPCLTSAAVVFYGPQGAVTWYAAVAVSPGNPSIARPTPLSALLIPARTRRKSPACASNCRIAGSI